MANRKTSDAILRCASELNVPVSEVNRAISSFFAAIVKEADSLPFDDERKIYTKEKFIEYANVTSIPHIGRIGPIYSRYLKWRRNESNDIQQGKRSDYRVGLTRGEIEDIAAIILSGGIPQIKKKKNSELFNRVWMVGKDGKKSARQVIPKEEDNGI